MTENEFLKNIDDVINWVGARRNHPIILSDLGVDTIIKALNGYKQYRSIGTVEECRAAVEKQRAKKYKAIEPCKSVAYYQCPCCNGLLHINENFCGDCGQAILWEEEDA